MKLDYYIPDVINYSYYYPFGMQMPDRKGGRNDYRFAYQGSEVDNEVKGNGNSYTTYFRQLDTRLGRWMSLDPVRQPWQSPYCSMDNNPIFFNDILGDKVGYGGTKKEQRKAKRQVFWGRVFSKEVRQEFKANKESEAFTIYTINSEKPSLEDGGKITRMGTEGDRILEFSKLGLSHGGKSTPSEVSFGFPKIRLYNKTWTVTKYKKSFEVTDFEREKNGEGQTYRTRNFELKGGTEVRFVSHSIPDELKIFNSDGSLENITDQTIHPHSPLKQFLKFSKDNPNHIATRDIPAVFRISKADTYKFDINFSGAPVNENGVEAYTRFKLYFSEYNGEKGFVTRSLTIPLLWKPKKSVSNKIKGL